MPDFNKDWVSLAGQEALSQMRKPGLMTRPWPHFTGVSVDQSGRCLSSAKCVSGH